MDIFTPWLRSFLPSIPVTDAQLAEDLTLRGIAVEGIFPAPGGSRFEMDITTNRVDAMNHYGVAREAAAIYQLPLAPLTGSLAAPLPADVEGPGHSVRIDAPDLCGRFTTRVLRNVSVSPASGLIAEYFAALGQKPISAPVDATNFGWLAMGQPTHVFDLDKIQGSLIVRRAGPGEKLTLLDGIEHTLSPEDLVVADEVKPLGLAGVMGGFDSRVTESTRNILVEAAWFDPAAIRSSSRRHGLHTDASHRFERGADFNAPPLANHLVCRLILAQCGGRIEGPLTDVVIPSAAARTSSRAQIPLRVAQVQRHLGVTLDDAQRTTTSSSLTSAIVEQYLTALGCILTPTEPGAYEVQLPSWRLDLEREIDLIEEVARVYGYNRFADTLPGFSGSVVELPHAAQEQAIRHTMLALGFSEAVSSTFVSAEEAATFGDPRLGSVAMGNPLSEEAGMLRPSLAPNMASMLANNLHRDSSNVRLFELGTAFTGSVAAVHEHQSLALGATGSPAATALHRAEDALLFEVKGALELLLAKFEGQPAYDTAGLPAWIAAGRGAAITLAGQPIAVFGELSAAETQRRKLRQPCVVAELNASTLFATALRRPIARDLSRFQAVERDFSFIFPDSVRWSAIEAALRALSLPELQRIAPLEIFRDPKGKAIAPGTYSLLTRVVFQSMDRTLTEDELTAWCSTIASTLSALGGTQRA
jgi:phenylalanyl-tRNA synthetase beta chain